MKNKIISLIVVMLLLTLMVGVTYSFFNYTRTGAANTLKVGRIAFNSTQNNTISLENVFPTSSTNLNSSNSDTVTINITGDTTYSEGIEYKVTLDQINNTINDKEIPISFNVTASNLGTKDSSYYTNRGGATPIYNLTETGQVEDGKYILVGYIPQGSTGVNGSIDITAFIDADRIAISDTVSRIENGNLIYGDTPGDWIAGRTVFTTTEWNSFTSTPLSFKVKVEANEGIWVEEKKLLVMKNLILANDSNWINLLNKITSIEFSTSSEIPNNAIASFDATDVTSAGPVTVYTLDDGLSNETYKVVICGDGIIYAPENSLGLFAGMPNLERFNLENFKVDNVTNMQQMFYNCSNLMDINSLLEWNTSNVNNMQSLLQGCKSLTNVNGLINWDVSNVTDMHNMFANCTNLINVNGVINWNTSNVTNMQHMFYNCTNLANVDGLSKWNTSSVTDMSGMFRNCTNLANVDGLMNWNTSNVTNMNALFYNCTNLANVDGLMNWNTSSVTNMNVLFYNCTNLANVDGLMNWNTSSVTNMQGIFYNCTNLINVDGLINWDVENVKDMSAIFANCPNLIDFSPLVGWANKTGNVTNMAGMFALDGHKIKTGNPVIDFSCLANWDVSNVENMSQMFQNINIQSYEPFRNWNVSKVQKFSDMFNATSSSPITTLKGLENWDVSSATDMIGMFQDNFSLTDASAINDWNVNSSIDFTQMFYHDTVHPEFTKVSGTWDSEGTFTPNI